MPCMASYHLCSAPLCQDGGVPHTAVRRCAAGPSCCADLLVPSGCADKGIQEATEAILKHFFGISKKNLFFMVTFSVHLARSPADSRELDPQRFNFSGCRAWLATTSAAPPYARMVESRIPRYAAGLLGRAAVPSCWCRGAAPIRGLKKLS